MHLNVSIGSLATGLDSGKSGHVRYAAENGNETAFTLTPQSEYPTATQQE
jgi:hypothetical protein